MNDQYLMENYLLVLKSNVEVYVHGTLESSNINNLKLLKKCLDTTMNSQKDTFSIMAKNNWYKVNNIAVSSIKKCLNTLKSKN